MATVQGRIPVIDFSLMNIEHEHVPSNSDERVQELASSVCKAFSDTGFVYLKNTGISDHEIIKAREVADKFFMSPVEEKTKFAKEIDLDHNHGWVALERERCCTQRPGDLKEAFNVELNQSLWPTEKLPEMKPTIEQLFKRCIKLAYRILEVLSTGLKIEKSPDWLIQCHQNIGKPGNRTSMRLLYYPPIPDDYVIKKDQVRCGEHSDFGSFTLLFQDELGGLQVLPVQGDYILAPSLPGCVLVNMADIMQRWTADSLISTKHRVLIPADDTIRNLPRRSLVFFVAPDDNCVIECLDGSNKYPPITCREYLQQRMNPTFMY